MNVSVILKEKRTAIVSSSQRKKKNNSVNIVFFLGRLENGGIRSRNST